MAGPLQEKRGVTRKLAAILAADVQGYSRLMGEDEVATLRTLTAYREVTDALIAQYHGRIVNTAGDSILAEFASVVDAVQCAVDIQHQLAARNADLPENRRMAFRIGINLGDVMVEGEQIYGDGVNIAARLESLADGGGICIAGNVYEQVRNKLPLYYGDLGEQTVKNIAEPVRVWRIVMEVPSSLGGEGQGEGVAREARSARPEVQSAKNSRAGFARRNWTVMAATGLLLLVGTSVAVRYWPSPILDPQSPIPSPQPLPLPDKPSIVVLPFTNMSNDPEQEYFSDGITDDLTGDLSKLSGLFVIARNSAFTYKGKAVKVQDVGQELGVRYVLEGSVRRADGRVRINTQLVDASTGRQVWAERYEREQKDIFALQDEITQRIVASLRVEVQEVELERVRRTPTENLTAYDYVLRGAEYYERFTREANVQARQMFERAITLDPTYAEAYARLGWTYYLEWGALWSQDSQILEQAFTQAQKAIALNDSLPQAHQVLGALYLWKKQHEQAIAEIKRAIALDPNDADSYGGWAHILNFAGQPQEAIELVQKAMRLNPRYLTRYPYYLGLSYYLLKQYEEAISALKEALARNPDLQPAHLVLAATYTELGREEEAQVEVDAVLGKNPTLSLDGLRQRVPLKDPAVLGRYLAALRKAGLK